MPRSSFLRARPRAFLVAVSDETDIKGFCLPAPSATFHPKSLLRAARAVADSEWIWWALPPVTARKPTLTSLYERDAPWDPKEKTTRLIGMLSDRNRKKLDAALRAGGRFVGTGYKRTRPDKAGRRVQRLEIRFDGVAGCLRTPEGGSSRQIIVAVENGKVQSRLLTVRECARLMGAPDRYSLAGNIQRRLQGDGRRSGRPGRPMACRACDFAGCEKTEDYCSLKCHTTSSRSGLNSTRR